MKQDDVRFDWERKQRTGIPEVVFGEGKTANQLLGIASAAIERKLSLLMTRVSREKAEYLAEHLESDYLDWHESSRTLFVSVSPVSELSQVKASIAIVAAGTSDHALVAEVQRCLQFFGLASTPYMDVGVAGLWRLTSLVDQFDKYSVFIAVAGMEGALFSVLSGLVKGPVIALPSSVGYGVSEGGHTALNCALASCSPGLAVVNIDNGFGAAALASKMLSI